MAAPLRVSAGELTTEELIGLLDSGGYVYQYTAVALPEAKERMHEALEEWNERVHERIDGFGTASN
ncbi:putative DNA binding protein [Halalkalicoccus jeotgali B3]|uniref:DNA binding protein n=1 Tax=Halalkalicoccus jeotgali (strain DSM 18796 / CECT 7217 / JCM 14584 / KCTC 4019 / B3) TaxID=795797 RepID=D8J503_HALJB|nr:putative DNA binding protein [Halalkalicoccus jeotgali B3]ELY33395.1 putative DNA binding protein [Halalkalicoccus jeotgali B3]